MSRTITIQEAARRLAELLRGLAPGDEIVLTDQDREVGKIIPTAPLRSRRAGSAKGVLVIHREDDEHLDAFKGYMP